MGELPEMKGFFLAAALACIAVGALLGWGLPELWTLLKPLLHAMTA